MTREEKIDRAYFLCDSVYCHECPNDGKKSCCEFEGMTEEDLDIFLEHMELTYLKEQSGSVKIIAEEDNTSNIQVSDAVHPNHYKLPNGMQVVDVEVAMLGKEAVQEHCLCTAVEYILRHKGKNGAEDIRKAHWWLSKWVELEDTGLAEGE